jgi:hypothetical protein
MASAVCDGYEVRRSETEEHAPTPTHMHARISPPRTAWGYPNNAGFSTPPRRGSLFARLKENIKRPRRWSFGAAALHASTSVVLPSRTPPHTTRFQDNVFILDCIATNTLGAALATAKHTLAAWKMLAAVATFCEGHQGRFHIFDCGMPRSTGEEDTICPPLMETLLNDSAMLFGDDHAQMMDRVGACTNVASSIGAPNWSAVFAITGAMHRWLTTQDGNCVILLGSSTAVLHTLAAAYLLRVLPSPTVDEALERAIAATRAGHKGKSLDSPDNKSARKTSVSPRRANNSRGGRLGDAFTSLRMVQYVKTKLGLGEKFDKTLLLKNARLLGDVLHARRESERRHGVSLDTAKAPSPGTDRGISPRASLDTLSLVPPSHSFLLKTIVLHSIPRVTNMGCRPYVMITDGIGRLLYSSMTAGVRNATWLDKVVVFHPLCTVTGEVRIRVYHLPNGRPGVKLFGVTVRPGSLSTSDVEEDCKKDDARVACTAGDRVVTFRREDLALANPDEPCIGQKFAFSLVAQSSDVAIDPRDSAAQPSSTRFLPAVESALLHRDFSTPPLLKCANVECGRMIEVEPITTAAASSFITVCPTCNQGTPLPPIAEPTRDAAFTRLSHKGRFARGVNDEGSDGHRARRAWSTGSTWDALDNGTQRVLVGDRVMALWKDGQQRSYPGYYPGIIVRHNQQNGTFAVLYDDGYLDRHVHRSSIKTGEESQADLLTEGDRDEVRRPEAVPARPPPRLIRAHSMPPPPRHPPTPEQLARNQLRSSRFEGWLPILQEMFPAVENMLLCRWIEHSVTNSLTLERIIESLINNRLPPEIRASSPQMQENSTAPTPVVVNTPMGTGIMETEKLVTREGTTIAFSIVDLGWGIQYVMSDLVQVVHGSEPNMHNAEQMREDQISADEIFARQLQESLAGQLEPGEELTAEQVSHMADEELMEMVLREHDQELGRQRARSVPNDPRQPSFEELFRQLTEDLGHAMSEDMPNVEDLRRSAATPTRHYHRGGRRGSRRERSQPSNFRHHVDGATVRDITRLPTWKYVPNVAHDGTARSCAVCMEDYEQDEILRTLPCLHQFHASCVDEWLGYKSTCPMCKGSIVEE